MVTFKRKLECKTFLATVSALEVKGKGMDSSSLLMLSNDKEQKAESYVKEHNRELFLPSVILTARYLNEKYETPSVKIRQMFDVTTKTKTKRPCYQHNLLIHKEILSFFNN